MRKATIHWFEHTTTEERWKEFLEASGKTEEEMPLKKYIEIEYRVYSGRE